MSVADCLLPASTHPPPTSPAPAASLPPSPLPSLVIAADSASLGPPLTRSLVHEPAYIARWLDTIGQMELQSACTPHQLRRLASIREYITHGVRLDLLDDAPVPLVYANSPSVALHSGAVRERLAEYMEWGAVCLLPSAPARIQPLLVIIKLGRKPRLCIDLSRNLNEYLVVPQLSYSSVTHAVQLSYPGCWYCKLDLSNCYLSFHLHSSAIEHFAFAFEGKYYCFVRMPFGLSSAPYICTELLSVVAHSLTQRGIVLVRYLDDFLLISPSESQAARDLIVAQSVFRHYGLVVNPAKTEGPAQCLSFLGVLIDSVRCTLSVTADRMLELLQLLSGFRADGKRSASAHELLSLVGKLSFAAACLPGARPFMRRMLDLVPHGKSQRRRVDLSSSFHSDVLYWSTRLPSWNGRCSWIVPAPLVLVTDASTEGFGFHLHSLPPGFDAASLPESLRPGSGVLGVWSACHQPLVATHRQIQFAEMFAALAAVLVYSPFVRNCSVLLLMDNSSDVGAINRQSSRSKTVCLLVRALFDLSYRCHFAVRARHIAGSSNLLADFLSRPSLHQHQPMQTYPLLADRLDSGPLSVPALSAVTVLHSSSVRLTELLDSSALHSSSTALCRPSNSYPCEWVPVARTRPITPTTSAGVE